MEIKCIFLYIDLECKNAFCNNMFVGFFHKSVFNFRFTNHLKPFFKSSCSVKELAAYELFGF